VRRSRLGRVVAIGLVAACPVALATLATADTIDPTLPRTVVVGPPRGAAPAERLDARRTGRTPLALPSAPAEIWRHNLGGGLDVAPLVDARGDVVAALTSPEVVRLGADGRERWRARLGPAAAVAAPVLTSDGTMVVVTAGGQAIGLWPSGALRYATSLGARGTREADASPLALEDGGVLVASGRSLIELDADGAVRARATLEERPVGGLVAGPEGALVTTESGAVFSFRAPGAPRRLGSFGGVVRRGAALADARTLVGVVDGRALVAFDLVTGAAHVRVSAPAGALFDGPPAIDASGLALAPTTTGLVIGADASGSDRLRVAIDRAPLTGDAGVTFFGAASPESRPTAPLVVDAAGRVAFARPGGRSGVIAADGAVTLAAERTCGTPIALAPAADRRLLVACRDGVVLMLGD
jgi:hypothetical protein